MFRRSAAVAAVALIASAVLLAQPARRTTVTVQLLALNDFHGSLEPPSGGNGRVGSVIAGGAAYLATHLKRAVADNPNSLVVAAGDVIGASPLISSLMHNEPASESLNAMHLAVSSVGNHEFDGGWQELMRMQKGGCHPTDGCQPGHRFAGAAFEYLAANVVRTTPKGDVPLFPATAMRTIAGVKIGFIGETLRDTPAMLAPGAGKDLKFLDEAEIANRYAATLKRQGADFVVLLIHEGGRQAGTDPNGCDNLSGGIIPIAQKLSPDIGIVLSAHSHRFYNCMINGRHVSSAGAFGQGFTRVTLTIDRTTHTVTKIDVRNEIATRDVEPDPEQSALISRYAALAAPIAGRPIGSAVVALTRDRNAAGETTLGDVIADAQLARALVQTTGGVDLAVTNLSGIRSDFPAGAVSFNDLFSTQPFGNILLVSTITGSGLKELLEQQFDTVPLNWERILQVSAGFTYRYALNAPRGAHVDANSITLTGRRILPGDAIRIAANDFIRGCDGFTALQNLPQILSAGADIDALEAYMKMHSPIAAPALNRIVRTD